jgi:hypothetical protein
MMTMPVCQLISMGLSNMDSGYIGALCPNVQKETYLIINAFTKRYLRSGGGES